MAIELPEVIFNHRFIVIDGYRSHMILLYSRQYPIKIRQDGGFCGPVHGEPSDNRAFGTSPVVTSKRFATSPPGAAEDHSLGKVVASSWTCDRWQRTFAESSVTRG